MGQKDLNVTKVHVARKLVHKSNTWGYKDRAGVRNRGQERPKLPDRNT